jgi:hypothetical protein
VTDLIPVVTFLLAAAAVCVLPGAACVLAFRPARLRPTLIDALGLSMLASIVVAQVMTSVAILAHLPLARVTQVVVALSVGMVLLRWRRGFASGLPDWADRLFLAGTVLIAVLVLPASQTFPFEDQIHVSVIRRLMVLDAPTLSNIYLLPDIVYTYPLPGLHGIVASVASLAGLDPIFAYAKMRFVWTVATLLIYYRLGAVLFGGSLLYRRCSAVALLALTLNGTLSKLAGFYAGQMTTVPHVSDVAMNVCLTVLLVRRAGRGRGALFCLWLGLLVTLTLVHIREIVQVAVYLGAFVVVSALTRRRERLFLVRAAFLLCVTVAIAGAWGAISLRVVASQVNELTGLRRDQVGELFRSLSVSGFLYPPLTDNRFTTAGELTFRGWFSLLLLALPLLAVIQRRRPGARFALGSSLAYALIIRVPLLTIPFVYATYFEVLFTPIRNFFPFLYTALGPLLAEGLRSMAGRSRWRGLALAGAVVVAFRNAGPWFAEHEDMFWSLVILASIIGLLIPRPGSREPRSPSMVPESATIVLVGLLIAAGTWFKDATPLTSFAEWSKGLDPNSYSDASCGRPLVCNPPPAFIRAARPHLRSSDLVAISVASTFTPTFYFDSRVTIWPNAHHSSSWMFTRPLFPHFYPFFDAAQAKGLKEPFFDPKEDDLDRLDFIRAMRATHVLIDPLTYKGLTPVLRRTPRQYAFLVDNGNWALVAVK